MTIYGAVTENNGLMSTWLPTMLEDGLVGPSLGPHILYPRKQRPPDHLHTLVRLTAGKPSELYV